MKFVDPRHDCPRDPWHTVGGEDGPMVTITPASHLLLTLAQWHSVRASWPADKPVAVLVPNDHDIEELAPDLPRLAMVSLQFPKWTDGRAYSQARLLRSRYRYRGELRATGDVLVDMVPLLARTGFDVAVLRHDQSPEAAAYALKFFPQGHYQADVAEHRPRYARTA
ncbi:MAG TPA: DUF934 domain-containing protein [Methylibium sp.]|nr:DUF934 domain-containing protein [Methylibium sp.]